MHKELLKKLQTFTCCCLKKQKCCLAIPNIFPQFVKSQHSDQWHCPEGVFIEYFYNQLVSLEYSQYIGPDLKCFPRLSTLLVAELLLHLNGHSLSLATNSGPLAETNLPLLPTPLQPPAQGEEISNLCQAVIGSVTSQCTSNPISLHSAAAEGHREGHQHQDRRQVCHR